MELFKHILENENIADTLEINHYLSYILNTISKKPVDRGLFSQLMMHVDDYTKTLTETIRASAFEAFIQKTVNSITHDNDILAVLDELLEHPLFKQYFSIQILEQLKNKLLNKNQYLNAKQIQINFGLFTKILEKVAFELNDFHRFVECCLTASRFEEKTEGNHKEQIFDMFIQKFSIEQLLSDTAHMENLDKLPEILFNKILEASIQQYKQASKDSAESIRLKMLDMLHFVITTGTGDRIKTFLSKTSDILQLDAVQKERLLFDLIEHNLHCQLNNDSEAILAMLNIPDVLKDESKKEHLLKLSIENHLNHLFLDYLLSKGYLNTVSPMILETIMQRNSMPLISILLKNSVEVEKLLSEMHAKHLDEKQAPSTRWGIKPTSIISQFIQYQLSCKKENRVGDEIIKQLLEKIGANAFMELMIPIDKLITQGELKYRTAAASTKLLAITEFPTLCNIILAHYQAQKFSDLSENFFSCYYGERFDDKVLKEFAERFDQAIVSVAQPSDKPSPG